MPERGERPSPPRGGATGGQASRLLAERFLRDHAEEAASTLERRPPGEVAALLEEVPARVAAEVLRRTSPAAATACLERLPPRNAAEVLDALPIPVVGNLVRPLRQPTLRPVLRALPKRTREDVRSVLRYPARTAGALMDPRIFTLPPEIGVEEAIRRLRRAPASAIYYLYVVDRERRLVGVLNVRELLLADPATPIPSVMHSPVVRLLATADAPAILRHPGWRTHHSLPVVDDEGRFLGAIRYETLRTLEGEIEGRENAASAVETAMRLGELGWIALTALLSAVVTPVAATTEAGTGRNRSAE